MCHPTLALNNLIAKTIATPLEQAQVMLEIGKLFFKPGCMGSEAARIAAQQGSPRVATFEMGYSNWIDEQNRHIRELRTALQAHVSENELRILVDSGMRHYYDLFRMKADAAKADVFYLMSGMWKTPTERFFLWIGGFRPSELLKVLTPQLDPLSEQQIGAVYNLQVSSQQFEDALYQGIAKFSANSCRISSNRSLRCGKLQIADGNCNGENLVTFVNQADHLRQQTLKQMSRILTTRQAARGLLALGDYFQPGAEPRED
ncbi:hypothetical protein GIB67_026120 [Kingdonia uniflora]|uniref:DOG1 domain-containing protein n=1 Tax=Kingdonia uniflora TaxID=39325 RepID=A0A7J7M3A2_9MAGN|nr:hypothetical protein GIB67_026120 [Kingdonia uniflora]